MSGYAGSGRASSWFWLLMIVVALVIWAGALIPSDAPVVDTAYVDPPSHSGVDLTAADEDSEGNGLYPSKVSVVPGESIDFHISNGQNSPYTLSIYREGSPRRLMGTINNVRTSNHGCAGGYATGCGWPVGATLVVPKEWPSGIYTVDMPRQGGRPMQTLFIVRAPQPTARILFLASVNTYQAYNDYGGGSLYGLNGVVWAEKVSFNRPYNHGTGLYERWESKFVAWAEKAGYKVDYAATYDLEFVPTLLNGYDVVIIAGHSEYWTWDMRQRVKAFINGGGRFMNLSGNTMWWQVRFEDNGRTMVGYKAWKKDPVKEQTLSTDMNWDRPINDSSFSITGLHWPYGGYPGGKGDGYNVVKANHWIYQGTGLVENQLFGKGPTVDTSIQDKETDGLAFNCAADGSTILGPIPGTGTPANFTILGITPVKSKQRELIGVGMMGLYTVPSGGAVFSAGTTGWVLGLDQPAVDRITRNVIDRFLARNFPQEPVLPGSDHLFMDRFNCNALNAGRFMTPMKDAHRLNYITTFKAAGGLKATCGVNGSGLEMPGSPPGMRFVAGLRPNWGETPVLHTRFYLNLGGFKIGNGAVFTLMQQYADNRVDPPVVVAAVEIGKANNVTAIRYVTPGANWEWVPVPANRFFRVDTTWDSTAGVVSITINGTGGYRKQVALNGSPLPNRADFGALGKKGAAGGRLCLDELIYDDRPIRDTPFALAP